MEMLDWDRLEPGERFGPFVYEVSEDLVTRFRKVVDDHESPWAPPALLTFAFLGLIDATYAPRPGTIHAEQEFVLVAPIRVGATLTLAGVLSGKEVKRRRRYFTVLGRAVDEHGVEVATSRTVGLCP